MAFSRRDSTTFIMSLSRVFLLANFKTSKFFCFYIPRGIEKGDKCSWDSLPLTTLWPFPIYNNGHGFLLSPRGVGSARL